VGETPIQSKPKTQGQTRNKETPSVPQKTKEQWLTEGNTLRNLKRYEEALADYEQAIRLDPNFADAYNSKGAILNDLKRHEEALAANEQAIRLDPNISFAHYGKGLLLISLDNQKKLSKLTIRLVNLVI